MKISPAFALVVALPCYAALAHGRGLATRPLSIAIPNRGAAERTAPVCPNYVVDLDAPLPPPEPLTEPAIVTTESSRTLFVDGRPVFPLGIYGLDYDVMDEAAEAGFNLTHTYTACCDGDTLNVQLDYLDHAAQAGLRALVYPFNTPNNIYTYPEEELESDIAARATHPGLFAWYTFDEPSLNGVDETLMADMHALLETLDPDHPDSLVDVFPSPYYSYRDLCDIQMTDPYPYPYLPAAWVTAAVRTLALEAGPDQPVWAVIQAHDQLMWICEDMPNIPWCWDHEPDAGPPVPLIRNMTYQAISAGATGILYWSFHASRYDMHDWPDHWEGIKDIAGEVARLSPILVSADITHLVDASSQIEDVAIKKSMGARRSAAPSSSARDYSPIQTPYRVFQKGQDMVVIVTNATPLAQEVTLDFSRMGQSFCFGDLEARSGMTYSSQATLDVPLEPWQHKVVQVSFPAGG